MLNNNIYGRLDGQVAIVTGGSKGIGYAIVKKLASEGAQIIIADISENETKKTIKNLNSKGYNVDFFILDIRDIKKIYKMTEYCEEKYGKINILINNAGTTILSPSLKLSEEDFDTIMDTNIKGAFFASQAAGRVMRKNGDGKIVNISSVNSRMVNIGRAPYCISKSGINAMTSILGAEWAMYGIRVNAIAPGWILTDMLKKGLSLKALNKKQLLSVSPVERFGKEEEIANLTCYLCSNESTYINGQTIFCDGGFSTGMLPNALEYIKKNDIIDY